MPRGIAYGYEYYMLVRPDLEEVDEEGTETSWWWDDFKRDVGSYFKADTLTKPRWVDRSACIVAENDRLEVGIDGTGDCECVFVLPKEYYPFGDENREPEKYNVYKDVKRGFNSMIKTYGPDTFGVALSWLHGKSLTKWE